MAIQYLFPIPSPVLLVQATPAQLAELPEEIRATLPVVTADSFLTALGQHQVFTRPKGLEIWDQVELAIEDRAKRRELEPEGPDYFAVPSQVMQVLQTCINEPMFFQATDTGNQWLRGLPYPPTTVRLIRAFIDMIKNPKTAKPVKAATPETPPPVAAADALKVPETEPVVAVSAAVAS